MDEREIIDILNHILIELGFPKVEEHYYRAKLSDFLLMDSLDKVEFIIYVEKRFGIVITSEVMEALHTFTNVVDCVKDLSGFKTVRA